MNIKPEQLTKDLSRRLHASYLISGGEPLLVQEAVDQVRREASNRGFSERIVFDVGAGFDWNQVHGEVGALSLFSSKKIVEIRIPNGKPGEDGARQLISVCAALNADTLLIVVLAKLESAAKKSKWIKAVDAAGARIDVWPVNSAQLPHWIQKRLERANIVACPAAIEVLADRVEGNLLAASQEIEKLKLLGINGEIDAETMSYMVADSSRYNEFDLINKMLCGDPKAAIRTLLGLKTEGSEPLKVLWAITREIRKLLVASEHLAQGSRTDYALEKAGVWRTHMGPMRITLERFKPAHLRMFAYQAGAIDRGVKGLRDAKIWDELTTLVLSLSGRPSLSPQNIKHLIGE